MSSPDNQSLVDLETLRGLLHNNQEAMREILTLFVTEVPESLNKMRDQVENVQWELLRKTIHSIKIYYTYIGSVELANSLNQWETDLAAGGKNMHTLLMPELETKTVMIVQQLKEILNGSAV